MPEPNNWYFRKGNVLITYQFVESVDGPTHILGIQAEEISYNLAGGIHFITPELIPGTDDHEFVKIWGLSSLTNVFTYLGYIAAKKESLCCLNYSAEYSGYSTYLSVVLNEGIVITTNLFITYKKEHLPNDIKRRRL